MQTCRVLDAHQCQQLLQIYLFRNDEPFLSGLLLSCCMTLMTVILIQMDYGYD